MHIPRVTDGPAQTMKTKPMEELRRPTRHLTRLQVPPHSNRPRDGANSNLAITRRGLCSSRGDDRLRPPGENPKAIDTWHQSRLSKGLLEATNSLIQAAQRRARGYRSKTKMVTIIYLIAGKLPLPRIHTI